MELRTFGAILRSGTGCHGTFGNAHRWTSALSFQARLARWNDAHYSDASGHARKIVRPNPGSPCPFGPICRSFGSSSKMEIRDRAPSAASMEADSTIHCCDVETTAYFKESAASEAEASAAESSVAPHGRNYAWAELMNRVWGLGCVGMPALSRPDANPCSDSFTGCDRKNSRLPRPALPCSPNFVGCARIHGSSRSVLKSA